MVLSRIEEFKSKKPQAPDRFASVKLTPSKRFAVLNGLSWSRSRIPALERLAPVKSRPDRLGCDSDKPFPMAAPAKEAFVKSEPLKLISSIFEPLKSKPDHVSVALKSFPE